MRVTGRQTSRTTHSLGRYVASSHNKPCEALGYGPAGEHQQKSPRRGFSVRTRNGLRQCAAAQTRFLVKYIRPANRIRNTNTWKPRRLRSSICGSAVHARKVATSWAYCATVAGEPSSKVT